MSEAALNKVKAEVCSVGGDCCLFFCLLLVGILALLNLSLGYLLGELLGQRYYGFLALSFGYFLMAGILSIFRSYLLQRPIANSIVNQLQHQLSDKGA